MKGHHTMNIYNQNFYTHYNFASLSTINSSKIINTTLDYINKFLNKKRIGTHKLGRVFCPKPGIQVNNIKKIIVFVWLVNKFKSTRDAI